MDIRAIRNQNKLTQKQLAEKIGVSPYTVRRWEAGKTKPSPMAHKIIEILFCLQAKKLIEREINIRKKVEEALMK